MLHVSGSSRSLWIAAALVVASSVLYLSRLAWSPPYLSIEELTQARHALAFARTGRSLSGQRLPLYPAEPGYEAGWEPIGIYSTAALLKIVPFSEAVVRLPSAVGGVLNILLMFFLARRLFRSDAYGLAAALVLAVTPAHFIQSRIGTSQILVATFALSWLVCLARYFDTNRRRDLFLSTMSLGFGIYAYPGALVVMPLYWGATIALLVWRRRRVNSSEIAIACSGIAVALIPWTAWHLVHPERFGQLADYYTHNGYNQDMGLKSFLTGKGFNAHLETWWNSFSPERVFFSGDSSFRFSTKLFGYVLLPFAPFIIVGLWRLPGMVPTEWQPLIWASIVLGPLPAMLVIQDEFKRWLTILLFVTLAIISGIKAILDGPRTWPKVLAIALFLVAGRQFIAFVHDYRNDYRARSSFAFNGNLPAVIRTAAAAQDPNCVFFDYRLTPIAPYWEVYGPTGAPKPHVVDAEAADFSVGASCRAASVVVAEIRAGQPAFQSRFRAPGWSMTRIFEPDGKMVYYDVYRWTLR
jgi:4-amino-4-deoxy-L-arabinose transferase-like glycosyltransferase